MLRNIWTVFRKELLEVLRDRKTLIFMFVLPLVLIPVLASFAVKFATDAREKARTEVLEFAVYHGDRMPELIHGFDDVTGFERVEDIPESDIVAAIEDERLDFALVIPEQPKEGSAPVELHYNTASVTSKIDDRVQEIVDAHAKSRQTKALEDLGLATLPAQQGLLEPVVVQVHSTANMREVIGEAAGGMLPYMFIIFCFMGAMYPAIDLAAGEKERGTLETLLLAPVPRFQLVLGKFFVVFIAGVISAILAIVGMGIWLLSEGQELRGALGEVVNSVSTLDLVLIGTMLIPTAAIFASLLLTISIYAKSFKEAQSYTAPLNMLVLLPAALAMMPGVELDLVWAMIPVTNISLAIKELIKGTMDYNLLVVILASTTILAGGLLAFCTWWFRREEVLFRN
ncbi:MAG: ABC transporter permease [Nannocystaceae bacterium]